jgi:hypothetical protein
MVVPVFEFSYLVMIHPQFGFAFFKTLLYGPTQTTEPNQKFSFELLGALLMK